MRAPSLFVAAILAALPASGWAQLKNQARANPANEVRYFTSIDGLMDGNADVILKETHQGKSLTAAVLDVCYPVAKNRDRKDRFVVNLAVNGQALTGTTQSSGEKAPVNVKLTQKTNGDSVEFRGQITIGQAVTEVASTDNSDISEKEYLDSQSSDDGISAQPKDFTEVSPEAVAVRLKLDAAVDFLKGLKGQDVEIGLSSLTVGCDALRAGEQTISMSVDPDRATALIAKARGMPGVVAAGWTTGIVEMDRTLRFPAAEWRDGDKINKDKLAAAVSDVLAKTYAAKPAGTSWSATTGKLKLSFKRPSQLMPGLDLTETIEVTGLVAPDKPGGTDALMLWVGSPVMTTVDEAAGPKLIIADESSGDDESDQRNDDGSINALAATFKAKRWDADNSVWK
ncbi:MAG: hypothetical protein WA702_09100 [Bradyrhizobium sp.]|jgi:hypothetical protein|uniref:hypothetical protein n=1 Tax=Bradyrhizobium sp. TaxID=376 RepID=UPI003C798C0E